MEMKHPIYLYIYIHNTSYPTTYHVYVVETDSEKIWVFASKFSTKFRAMQWLDFSTRRKDVENLTLLNKFRHLLTNVRFSTSFRRKLKIACLFKSDWDSTYVSKTKFLPVLWFCTLDSTSCYVRKSCEKM